MSKRTRPCDACRTRKTRCSKEPSEPRCALCRTLDQPCTFADVNASKRRRLDSVSNASAASEPNGPRVSITIPGTGVEEYDALPDGTTLLKRTLGLQNAHHSRYMGGNHALRLHLTAYGQDERREEATEQIATVRFVHPDHAFRILPDSATRGHAWETGVLDGIEEIVQGNGKALVDLYFRIIHPAFPILHREVFLEKYARSYREFSPPLLAAVYLSASSYWTYSDALAAKAMPELRPLEQLALDSLQMAMESAKLSTVQATLLTCQYQAQCTKDVASEGNLTLTAQLVQIAHRLGLHLDAGTWDIPPWEVGLRRRLSWACIMQDKWLAHVYSRPSMINMDSWDVRDLRAEDFPEVEEDETAGSSEVEKGRLAFAHMASLTTILSDATSSIFSSRAQRHLQDTTVGLIGLLSHVKPTQLRLKAWFSDLPTSLKMDTAASMKLSSAGYLRLAYLSLETSLHRIIITSMSSDTTSDLELVRICRMASMERLQTACDFFGSLTAPQLAACWSIASAECAASIYHFGQLLEATAVDHDDRVRLAQMIKACRWSFKLHSQGGSNFAKRTLSILQASDGVTNTRSASRVPT